MSPAVAIGDGGLAAALQEVLTVTVRLRADRRVAADADQFRVHVKSLLARADEGVRGAGYHPDSSKLAIYAIVAFLDESVLNSTQPMFGGWARQPLQEEIFGDHMGGENFFRNLEDLQRRPDSPELADLLDVHLLCLLLGFRGRYGGADQGALQGSIVAIGDRIRRIRGATPPPAPAWRPPESEEIPRAADPWVRRLGIVVMVLLLVSLVLYLAYRAGLSGGIAEFERLAAAAVSMVVAGRSAGWPDPGVST